MPGGEVAVVDAVDAPLVNRYSWYAQRFKHTTYAQTTIPGHKPQRRVLMHRLLMGEPDCDVDHRDGDGLNNRRANIRLATRTENCANTKKKPGCSSRYKGVRWSERGHCWRAAIYVKRTQVHLGCFKNEDEAGMAYDIAADIVFGEFARKNFPDAKMRGLT